MSRFTAHLVSLFVGTKQGDHILHIVHEKVLVKSAVLLKVVGQLQHLSASVHVNTSELLAAAVRSWWVACSRRRVACRRCRFASSGVNAGWHAGQLPVAGRALSARLRCTAFCCTAFCCRYTEHAKYPSACFEGILLSACVAALCPSSLMPLNRGLSPVY